MFRFQFHRYSSGWMWHVRNVNCGVWQIFMAALSLLTHIDTLPFFTKENSPDWNILWHISISPAPWIMAVLWANNGALCSCCETLENLILFLILMISWHGKIGHCHQFNYENLIQFKRFIPLCFVSWWFYDRTKVVTITKKTDWNIFSFPFSIMTKNP